MPKGIAMRAAGLALAVAASVVGVSGGGGGTDSPHSGQNLAFLVFAPHAAQIGEGAVCSCFSLSISITSLNRTILKATNVRSLLAAREPAKQAASIQPSVECSATLGYAADFCGMAPALA